MSGFAASLGFTVRLRRRVASEFEDEAMAVADAKMKEIRREMTRLCDEYEVDFSSNGIIIYGVSHE